MLPISLATQLILKHLMNWLFPSQPMHGYIFYVLDCNDLHFNDYATVGYIFNCQCLPRDTKNLLLSCTYTIKVI